MFRIVFVIFLISAYGRSASNDKDGDPKVWDELRDVLPDKYVEYAEQLGLNKSKWFHNDVIRKLHTQVVRETQLIEGRQRILGDYVDCSCPKCHDNYSVEDLRTETTRQQRVNPIKLVTNLFTSCETSLTLDTIKILRKNVYELQVQNRELTRLVVCNCPHSEKCRHVLDPLVYSVVNGNNDTELSRIYWQDSMEGFPVIVERGVMDRLTNAIAAIMTYAYQYSRPQHDAQQSPTQYSQPPTIFSPGHNEESWHTVAPNRKDCPSVQVSITNNKEGSSVTSDYNPTSENPVSA